MSLTSQPARSARIRKSRCTRRNKAWYAAPGDRMEQPIDGYVADLVRGDELIEIQTRNFGALKR